MEQNGPQRGARASGPVTCKPPTTADIARHAGVSRATVSYVLNGVPNSRVSEETRQRVLNLARDLGYVPHALARSLRAGHSNLVLLPIPGLPSVGPAADYFTTLIAELHRLGYEVIFYADRADTRADAPRAWASLRPAGIIVDAQRLTDAALDMLHSTGTRAVLAVGEQPSPLVPTLVIDHAAVGACAAEYLVAQGHRQIAAVVPQEADRAGIGLAQLRGVARVATVRGIEVQPVNLAFGEAEAARLAALWKDGPCPSAVFAHNDEYGLLLIRALLDAGVAVPGQVAVVGADDLPMCALVRPRLTSIHLDVAASAAAVARILHATIRGTETDAAADAIDILRPRVVSRESAPAG